MIACVWTHLGGDDEHGRCLTCVMLSDPHETVRPHRVKPDTDVDDYDIWCNVCGHSIVCLHPLGGDNE